MKQHLNSKNCDYFLKNCLKREEETIQLASKDMKFDINGEEIEVAIE
jgi:hypothetical protein